MLLGAAESGTFRLLLVWPGGKEQFRQEFDFTAEASGCQASGTLLLNFPPPQAQIMRETADNVLLEAQAWAVPLKKHRACVRPEFGSQIAIPLPSLCLNRDVHSH